MGLQLNGKVALITGGNRGIGKVIALQLAQEPTDIVLAACAKDRLDAAAEPRALTFRRDHGYAMRASPQMARAAIVPLARGPNLRHASNVSPFRTNIDQG